ncbi:FIG00767116: hypothetical protein [hydrothermal vent metagenome]|uniref:SAM-dependent methyltransferase n=1 Tax=hydrothermal vent metagenome TaxID=652676 RepID=A0A3B0TY64_9ZZZZ
MRKLYQIIFKLLNQIFRVPMWGEYMSSEGKQKAFELVKSQNTSFEYLITDALKFKTTKKFDALGLIYAHFPSEIRKGVHRHLLSFLNPGGIVIFEAFSKSQLENSSGGPKNESMLFSVEEIKKEFCSLHFEVLEEEEIELQEGTYHKGKASVIRFVGRKIK